MRQHSNKCTEHLRKLAISNSFQTVLLYCESVVQPRNMATMKVTAAAVLVGIMMILEGCAAGSNVDQKDAGEK